MFTQSLSFFPRLASPAAAALTLFLAAFQGDAQTAPAKLDLSYEHADTRALVALVRDAANLIQTKGQSAFQDFRASGSRWRQGETYVFVLDREGNMLVHPDPAMEGKNELDLKDINGKLIIRGLIDAAAAFLGKPEGWYHYQWPVPGGLLPRWKSSYVRLVKLHPARVTSSQRHVQRPHGKGFRGGCGEGRRRADREERQGGISPLSRSDRPVHRQRRLYFRH